MGFSEFVNGAGLANGILGVCEEEMGLQMGFSEFVNMGCYVIMGQKDQESNSSL